nr:MAG TPA: hypothetical protein [Caudoviricetes sp.]DAU59371.1 MAG TPA: hypothetical protein [Crassvirales sp.]
MIVNIISIIIFIILYNICIICIGSRIYITY